MANRIAYMDQQEYFLEEVLQRKFSLTQIREQEGWGSLMPHIGVHKNSGLIGLVLLFSPVAAF